MLESQIKAILTNSKMAKTIKGITIEIDGSTTKLQKALSDVNSKSKQTQSSLNQLNRLTKINPSSTELLAQKQGYLKEKISQTTEKLNILKKAQNDALNSGQIDKASEEYREFQREIGFAENELKKLKAEQTQLVAQSSSLGQVSTKMRGISETANKTAESVKGISMVAGVGLVGSLKVLKDFDAQMSRVKAISGANTQEFQALNAKAKEMGASTKFSALESAQALEYMGMAGWKSQQMIEGLPGIMNLAAASGEDLAMVSDIVTDGLTAFGMGAKDSGRFADVLASAATNANTNVGMLGESFKYVGPIAGSMNYSIEDTAVALGMMANSGIKASQAGTALRSWITRLAKPTKESKEAMDELGLEITNSDGSMKSLSQVMKETRHSFSGLTEAEKAQYAAMIAGKTGMSGLLAVVNSSDADFNKLASAIGNSTGAAEKMAKEMQDNLAGDIELLTSAVEGFALSIGEGLRPVIRGATQGITAFVDVLNAMPEPLKAITSSSMLFLTALYPISKGVGMVSSGLSSLTMGLATMKVKAGEGALGIQKLWSVLVAHPAVAVVASVAALGGAMYGLYQETNKLTIEYERNAKARQEAVGSVGAEIGVTNSLYNELVALNGQQNKSESDKIRMQSVVSMLNERVKGLNLSYNAEKDKLNMTTAAIYKKIRAMESETRASINAEQYKKTLEDQVKYEQEVTKLKEKRANLERQLQSAKDNPAEYARLKAEISGVDAEMKKLQGNIKNCKGEADKFSEMQVFEILVGKAQSAGHKIPQSLQQGIRNEQYTVPRTMNELLALTDKNFREASERVMKANGGKIPKHIRDGINSGKLSAGQAAKQLAQWSANNLKAKIDANKGSIRGKGKSVSTSLSSGMNAGKGSVRSSARSVANTAKNNLHIKGANSIGRNASQGIANGLLSGISAITSAAKKAAKSAWEAAKDKLGIHSPSRVMAELGNYASQGMAIGIEKGIPNVVKASTRMAEATIPDIKLPKVNNNNTYQLARMAMVDAVNSMEFSIVLDGRELGRGLKGMGVSFR